MKGINRFWWYWLIVVTVGLIIFSLGFLLIPDVMQNLFNWMFFSGERSNSSFSAQATRYLKFTYGVLGAVTVGWSVSLLFSIVGQLGRGERRGWYAVAVPVVVWFLVDSTFSLSSGFYENAIFNVLFFTLFAIPLLATYREMHAGAVNENSRIGLKAKI